MMDATSPKNPLTVIRNFVAVPFRFCSASHQTSNPPTDGSAVCGQRIIFPAAALSAIP